MAEPRLKILGIGNELMGDDGIGPVVARSLLSVVPLDVEVVVGGIAGMQLIGHFTAGVPVIVVDAIDTAVEPGAIFRFNADECDVGSLRSNTLHGHGLPYLIATARFARATPDVTVYAVQVGDVSPARDGLSDSVAVAASRVADLVAEDVAARLAAVPA